MKKSILIALIIGTILTAQAQNKVQFGVKGGLNIANLTGEDVENSDARTAFHIGAMAEIPLSEKFSFQPEILYSSQGIKENDENAELKLDYLNVPIMMKYYVADKLSIELGPQFGLLLSADAKVEGEGEGDVKELFNDFDFGAGLGLGYKVGNGLNFGLRYNRGLSRVFDDTLFFAEETKAFNSVFQFSVGYLF